MSVPTLPDKYRAYDKTDVVEIRRNPDADFNPEPTTIPKVSMLFPMDDALGIQALLRRVQGNSRHCEQGG